MLTLMLAMSVAVETPRVVTLPTKARPAATVRKRVARRAPVKRAPRMAKLCLTGNCSGVVPESYRLTGVTGPTFSGKMHAVRSTGVPCGVQGAPVCPKGGQTLVRAAID